MLFATATLLVMAQVEYLRPTDPVPAPTAARVERIQLEAEVEQRSWLVDVAHFTTQAIADILTRDTKIQVRSIPWDTDRIERQADSIRRFYDANPKPADAVLTMRSLWPVENLYSSARAHHLWTIEIDATTPLDGSGAGISMPVPNDGAASPPWVSMANIARMLEITARDFIQMAPSEQARIENNLNLAKQDLFQIRSTIAKRAAEIDNPYVVTLTRDHDLLLQECGYFIAARLDDPEQWDEKDWQRAEETIAEADPAFVVRDFHSSEEIGKTLLSRFNVRIVSRKMGLVAQPSESDRPWEPFTRSLGWIVEFLLDAGQR